MRADSKQPSGGRGREKRDSPVLRVELLGAFRISAGSESVDSGAWRLRKAGHLVKLLALEPSHRLHREQIIDRLWPESRASAGASNLRYALHVARRTLTCLPVSSDELLQTHNQQVTLYPVDQVSIDVEEFERAAAAALDAPSREHLQAALALYGGDLLPEDRYEDWLAGPRERLRERHLALLLELGRLLAEAGEHAEAIATLQRVLAAEPSHEAAHRRLMSLYAATGRRHQAFQQYEELRHALREELDVDPEPASQRLYSQILAGQFSPSAESSAADSGRVLAATTVTPGNLPAPLTRYIGREREMRQVRKLLQRARLVTLTGPGGTGKTRLSVETARGLADTYRDGACLVDLGPLGRPEHVIAATATALSISETPSQPLEAAVVDALTMRQVLLIVDNAEHLLDACAQLVMLLLSACPDVRILVTSREPLRVPGEAIWQVPPLGLAAGNAPAPVDPAQAGEAVQLFRDRARLVDAQFELTGDNTRTVIEICRRVDGLPLAIELAAARVPLLGVDGVLARLDDALALLTTGPRTAPPRHQALRATLDWSHELLDAAERAVFRRLAAFTGGWTLEAAEAVVADDGLAARGLLHLLAQLVDKSLVHVDARGDAIRYRFLETVRQYAVERLEASDEADAIRQRHAAAFLAHAETAELQLRGNAQDRWLRRLELDIDNLRTALQLFESEGRTEEQLRLAAALVRFWWIRGYPSEGRRWLDPVLDAERDGDAIAPSTRAKALGALGNLAMAQGDLAEAQRLHEESLALERERGDPEGIADALGHLGVVLSDQGQMERARTVVEESLRLRRALGNQRDIALSLGALGGITFAEGDYRQSTRYFEECLPLYRAAGDRHSVAISLNNLGEAVRAHGDLERATSLFRESLDLFRQLDAKHGVAYLLSNLGDIARSTGEGGAARTWYLEALELFRELGYQTALLHVVAGLAALIARRQPFRAATLFGAVHALREASGIALAPSEREDFDGMTAVARAALAEPEFLAAWNAGRTLSLDEVLQLASEIRADDVALTPDPGGEPLEVLSRREWQVARLIAAGRTNREIAEELGVAPRTADTHVSNILRKLGLSSRADVAAWIGAHGGIPDGDPRAS